MNGWGAIQYVGSGLSLVAFIVAAILYAYRAHLRHQAEIIKSAPEKDRLEAIATAAEFFRVDVSKLEPAQQAQIVVTEIEAVHGGTSFEQGLLPLWRYCSRSWQLSPCTRLCQIIQIKLTLPHGAKKSAAAAAFHSAH
jgi:hypothetical protein